MRVTVITAALSLSLSAVAVAGPIPNPAANAELETRGLGDLFGKGLSLFSKGLGKSDDTVSKGGNVFKPSTTWNPTKWKTPAHPLPKPGGPPVKKPEKPAVSLPEPPKKPAFKLPEPPK